jgi:hypothetical protein
MNVAILSCRAFTTPEPTAFQTWRIHLGAAGARLLREFPPLSFDLGRQAFDRDPRIAAMVWER